ncbi:hypothetical protein N7535_007163 [Penicillium sp. DV-2018c]|nr:hypothetical protein N7461_003187 [Penicillium sp. DV-2018c]KAJ5565525.1 hypothetical protein N7535_007163 [Penicillium sp. DV-2018c]
MTKIPATSTTLSDDVMDRERAARTVQRIYRGHRTRRELQGLELAASTRWVEAFKEAQWHQLHQSSKPHIEPGEGGSNRARQNWQRAVSVARRAGGDDLVSEAAPSPGCQSEPNTGTGSGATAKMMDLQYFLEMVDLKHRHGSNLRAYHACWRNSSSKENFFFWLDFGEGKNVEIPQCPREKLEREQVRYLTREERINYLVKVDESGHFRWAKNNELVWTNTAHFKDSLQGIVPIKDDAPEYNGNSPMIKAESTSDSPSSPSSLSSLSSSSPATESMHSALSKESRSPEPFTNEEYRAAKTIRKVMHPSPVAAFKRLVGKSSKKEGTWLFVADTSFRLYIGIKRSGAFQHSSFLRGARISAAGMIKIKHGQLRSLAPLSGHYRPSAANFRAFHRSLQQQGVDMSRVSMSKSYIMLAGVEGYTKTKRKARAMHEKVDESKHKLHKLTE